MQLSGIDIKNMQRTESEEEETAKWSKIQWEKNKLQTQKVTNRNINLELKAPTLKPKPWHLVLKYEVKDL